MKNYRIAIMGATGAVGQQMIKVLEERNFPISELRLLASSRSAGRKVPFKGGEIKIQELNDDSFAGMDFVLGAVSNPLSMQYAGKIVDSKAVFIDNSSAFRLNEDVPLVVPEINPDDARANNGIISNPNCSTIITLTALSGICRITPIRKMIASTYQAVSGAGVEGMNELEKQISDYCQGNPLVSNVFPTQILSNVIPMIGSKLENGYTTEEMKLQNEGRKILHTPDLKVCCTCVRVPVMRSHSISVQLVTEDPLSVSEACSAIANAPGCRLVTELNGRDFPTPLDTADQDLVYVGRVRRDLIDEDRGLSLWCCGDQIRKGAATNAVQIAMLLADLK